MIEEVYLFCHYFVAISIEVNDLNFEIYCLQLVSCIIFKTTNTICNLIIQNAHNLVSFTKTIHLNNNIHLLLYIFFKLKLTLIYTYNTVILVFFKE